MGVMRISAHSLTSDVGIGSRSHDLDGEDFRILSISSSDTGVKEDRVFLVGLHLIYGSIWGHKIVALEFCLISPLLLLLDLQNVLRGIGKAYVESLNNRSVLPPDPPLWAKLGS